MTSLHRTRSAFTLAELMIVLAVLGIFAALAMPVFINSLRSLNFTTNRIGLNRDFRSLTSRLMKEARASGQYIVYKGFTDRTVVTSANNGNFIVLLTLDANGCFVTKATGYYRHPTDGSVRRFSVTEPGTSAVPQNLPAVTAASDYPVIVEFAQDVTDSSSLLFLNTGTSIVIYGQIRDDSKTTLNASSTNPAAVSTYNFTISPRG